MLENVSGSQWNARLVSERFCLTFILVIQYIRSLHVRVHVFYSTTESVRMQYVEDDRKVYNNVVINRFQSSIGDDSKRNGKFHQTLQTLTRTFYRYIERIQNDIS